MCLMGAPAPCPLFFVVLLACFCFVCFATQGLWGFGVWGGCAAKGAQEGVGVIGWDTLEGFRIDWCFRRGLYESEGGVACQHLVLWNSRADFPCQ